jgi:hypothetical protein
MSWACKSCGKENPNNALKCGECGAVSPATKKFYVGWVIGGGVIFFLMYLVGVFVGGTLVEAALHPTEEEIITAVKDKGIVKVKVKDGEEQKIDLMELSPENQALAKEAAIATARSEMSLAVHSVLFWVIPFLLFPLCGVTIGFVSDGRTVIEAALASVLGQVIGFCAMRFMYGFDIHWLELLIGLIFGFVVSGVGAYVGEAVQEKRERESLELEQIAEFS